MNEFERDLMRSLQALAQPAEVQRALFPDFVVMPDELVLDFTEAFTSAREQSGQSWTSVQLQSLQTLDEEIALHSGSNFEEIWLVPDSLSHEVWSTFRTLAASALSEFNWPNDPPQPNGAIYGFFVDWRGNRGHR